MEQKRIKKTSRKFIKKLLTYDAIVCKIILCAKETAHFAEVAEWQTHTTQNRTGYPRAGSSPAFGTKAKGILFGKVEFPFL